MKIHIKGENGALCGTVNNRSHGVSYGSVIWVKEDSFSNYLKKSPKHCCAKCKKLVK